MKLFFVVQSWTKESSLSFWATVSQTSSSSSGEIQDVQDQFVYKIVKIFTAKESTDAFAARFENSQ